jgi:hypothetical protein
LLLFVPQVTCSIQVTEVCKVRELDDTLRPGGTGQGLWRVTLEFDLEGDLDWEISLTGLFERVHSEMKRWDREE